METSEKYFFTPKRGSRLTGVLEEKAGEKKKKGKKRNVSGSGVKFESNASPVTSYSKF